MSDEKRVSATQSQELTFEDLEQWQGAVTLVEGDVNIVPDGEFYFFAFDKDNNKIGMFNVYTQWGYLHNA